MKTIALAFLIVGLSSVAWASDGNNINCSATVKMGRHTKSDICGNSLLDNKTKIEYLCPPVISDSTEDDANIVY